MSIEEQPPMGPGWSPASRLTGLATLQRGPSTGLAGLQPGPSSTTTNSGRYAGLQPGTTGFATLQLGSSVSPTIESAGAVEEGAKPCAGLEPGVPLGEPTERRSVNTAGLEPGEPSRDARLEPGEPTGAAANTAKLELGEPSGPPSGELRWTDRGYMPHVDGKHLTQHVSYHLADSLPKEALEQMAAQLKSLPPKLRDAEKEKNIAQFLDAGRGSCILRVPEIAEMVQNAFLLFHNERYVLHEWCVMPNHVHVLFQPMNGWSMGKIVASWKSFTGRRISEYKRATLERGGEEMAGLEPGEPTTGHAGLQPGSSALAKLELGEPTIGHAGLQPGSSALAKLELGEPTTGHAGLQPGSSALATLERGEPSTVWHREYWDRYIRDQAHYANVVKYIRMNPVKAGLAAQPEDWKFSSAGYSAGLATLQRGSTATPAGLEPGEPSGCSSTAQ